MEKHSILLQLLCNETLFSFSFKRFNTFHHFFIVLAIEKASTIKFYFLATFNSSISFCCAAIVFC